MPTRARWSLGALGAALVGVAVGAFVWWPSANEAPQSGAVALIPGPTMLESSQVLADLFSAEDVPASAGLVVAPHTDIDPIDDSVWIGHRPDHALSPDDGEPIAVGDREGRIDQRATGGILLMVDDLHGGVIDLISGEATDLDDLLELALMIDPQQDWEDQPLGAEWRIIGATERGTVSTARAWTLAPPVESDDPAPAEIAPPTVWLITHSDTDLDPVTLHEFPASISPIEVRGTTGTVTSRAPGYYAVVVWEETPGVFARLRYGPSNDPVSEAVEVATALVSVDDEGWRSFIDTHGEGQGPWPTRLG